MKKKTYQDSWYVRRISSPAVIVIESKIIVWVSKVKWKEKYLRLVIPVCPSLPVRGCWRRGPLCCAMVAVRRRCWCWCPQNRTSDVGNCRNDSGRFPHYCSNPTYKAEHHVSAIAAIIAVGSHTIAQSEIRTSFSKENSEMVYIISRRSANLSFWISIFFVFEHLVSFLTSSGTCVFSNYFTFFASVCTLNQPEWLNWHLYL